MLDGMIANLEGALNLAKGEDPAAPKKAEAGKKAEAAPSVAGGDAKPKKEKKEKKEKKAAPAKAAAPPSGHPEICMIEFKVGVIVKVWEHPDADKLWCEEIDCGEDSPRQIASGLRDYYSSAGMLGHRLLVVANLKAKNLRGFKSHGMVVCAKVGDKVQFVEPPAGAPLGEVVSIEGMPEVVPASAAQVEKKKMFLSVIDKLKTNDKFGESSFSSPFRRRCHRTYHSHTVFVLSLSLPLFLLTRTSSSFPSEGTYDGHVFMTSAGPCKCIDLAGAPMS